MRTPTLMEFLKVSFYVLKIFLANCGVFDLSMEDLFKHFSWRLSYYYVYSTLQCRFPEGVS